MRIKRDTAYGYGTYEWQESERRLESLGQMWECHALMGVTCFPGLLSFTDPLTYDFEGGTK